MPWRLQWPIVWVPDVPALPTEPAVRQFAAPDPLPPGHRLDPRGLVAFVKMHDIYQSGEHAGFSPEEAAHLVRIGVAVYRFPFQQQNAADAPAPDAEVKS